ncbi:MAG: hypothetical protein WCE68_03215 [Anaerolineales bacterium]
MTTLGSQFKTGEIVTASGNYRFVSHLDGTTNDASAEALIPLREGEIFPPCKSCNKGAIWQLESNADTQ